MKNKLSCEIVKDLFPSYIDHLTSKETTEAVEAHLSECESCRNIYREMTNAEPPIAEQPQVDYLKKVRNSRRRIRNIAIIAACGVLALGITALVIVGHSKKKAASDAQMITSLEQQTEADAETITALEQQTETDAQTISELTETAEELQKQIELPTVTYNPETKALVIIGTGRYDETVIPEEAEDAISLDVQDDEFHLTMDPTVRNNKDETLKDFIPGFLDRTEKSLQFLRGWFRENAGEYYDPARVEKMIDFYITEDSGYLCRNNRDRIKIYTSRLYWNRDTALVYAMMDCSFAWAQIGYMQNLAFATDPYNEWLLVMDDSAEGFASIPYYQAAVKAGLDPDHVTPEGYAIMTDTIALYAVKEDWIHTADGRTMEYLPVSKTAFFTVSPETFADKANNEMTGFMAGSFIHRLTDVYGLDAVNALVFGAKTFDEAFGVDFDTAFAAWQSWLVETYPME